MLEVDLFGNGPSLNNINIDEIVGNKNILISCNRIFLHKEFKQFAHKTIICFSDISFQGRQNYIMNLSLMCKKIFYPSDFKWDNMETIKLIPYQINREKVKDSIVLNNIINFPYVRESCSVLFTIMLPLCMKYMPEKINLYGFDGTYSKSSKYFYKDSSNNDYAWSQQQEDTWEILFQDEMKSFMQFCRENNIEVMK
tara:strand:+ start:68 stop:658 length:591 start_codon:yes stop_codon:yes gene_type:complete